MFWKMEPLATAWGMHAAGLVELEVAPVERRQGLGTYLLGESFRYLHAEGLAVVEAQVRDFNQPAQALFAKLGFEQVDESVIYRKELDAARHPQPGDTYRSEPDSSSR